MTRYLELSRRERQVMDVLYVEHRARAARIRELLPDPPSYSAVRALLRVLEEKGCVAHKIEGMHYVYTAVVPRDEAKHSAVKHLVTTFFAGSVSDAVLTLVADRELSLGELDRLARVIEERRKQGGRR